MKLASREQLKKALATAKSAYAKGERYYDDKHNTYHSAGRVTNILENVSDLVGYYGVEAYEHNDPNPSSPTYEYVNSGDTYGLTVIHSRKTGNFTIGDIGSVIEKESNDHDNDEIEEKENPAGASENALWIFVLLAAGFLIYKLRKNHKNYSIDLSKTNSTSTAIVAGVKRGSHNDFG